MAATLLDRPYRRLVDDLPVRYVGFTVPDSLFVGYGFDLREQYRNLPDIRVIGTEGGRARRAGAGVGGWCGSSRGAPPRPGEAGPALRRGLGLPARLWTNRHSFGTPRDRP